MIRFSRVFTFFFLLTMLLVVSTAVSTEPFDDVEEINDTEHLEDFEEITDPELKERVAQQLAEEISDPELKERVAQQISASTSGESSVGLTKAPAQGILAKEKRSPFRLCGTFILCERKGGIFGFPDAKLFTSTSKRVFPITKGSCKTAVVKGTSPGGFNQFNHARLWPIWFEEFFEMCFYFEKQHACKSGQVSVVNSSGTTLYKCDKYYDAHTVTFCLSKFPFLCKFNIIKKRRN